MTTETLSPLAKQKFFDNNGAPANKYRVFTYQAGTTTKLATYTDSIGSTPNANPITLDFRGECDLWVPPNVAYKYVFAPPGVDDPPTTSIWTIDNIVNSQLITLYGGVDTGIANAYILNFTAQFTALSDGIVIYWIPSHNNTGGSTINVNGLGVKNIVNLNGNVLGANQIVANQITQIIYQAGQWQLLSVGGFTGVNVGTFGPITAFASAATVDLGSAVGHTAYIFGPAVTISSFGSSAQTVAPIYLVRIDVAQTITYNATSMILPGSADLTLPVGSSLIAEYLGSGNWQVLMIQNSSDVVSSYVGTLNGCATSPTDTVHYRISNGIVSLWVNGGTLAATSNSNAMTVSGGPAAIGPSSPRIISGILLFDNSVVQYGSVTVQSSGLISFNAVNVSGVITVPVNFTPAGTKGLTSAGFCVTYPL
jgi:hypothetical protein